jgi:biopolymer transport protein TolR
MGMAMGGKGKRRAMADINVTPLVDVMLVLLVIFMVTAPAMKEGFQVDLPQATATQTVMVQDVRLITITADGAVLHNLASSPEDKYERLADLVNDLKTYKEETEKAGEAPTVVINGDAKASYQSIIQVWNAVRTAGIPNVAFQLSPGEPDKL